jgi:tetratricopeptide (TPR) repeat protein
MKLFRELRQRRVIQFTSAYVVGGFGLVQFFEFLEGRLGLSPYLVNLVALALALLLPSVIVLAWSLGRPGRDKLGRPAMVAVPANAVLAVLLLFILFEGKELGAVTRTIEVQDEHGAVTERAIPKNEFRRRLILFYPENAGSTADDWARETVTLLLGIDVSQDVFLETALPVNLVDILRDAGHEDGHGLPRPLMRKIARDAHYGHFTTGKIRREGNLWHLTLELHESESGHEASTRDHRGVDIFDLVDRASRQLREDLGIPEAHLAASQDLPVAELASSDLEAVKSHVAGLIRVTHHNDWAGAAPALEDAVARDPGYALAQYLLSGVYQTMGRNEESKAAMAAAMDNLYRVPERTGYLIKSQYYFNVEQDMDKTLAVLGMWSRIYPDDVEAHVLLAMFHFIRQDLRAALTEYETILQIDPTQYNYLEDIADLYRQLGENDKAEKNLQRYVDRFPSRADGYENLADFYADTGRLDEARKALEQALLLDPGDLDLALELVELDVKLGRYAASREALDAELERAETPRDRGKIHVRLLNLAMLTGRGDLVAAELDSFYRNMARVQNPLQLEITYSNMLPMLSMVGRSAEAIARLDEAGGRIVEPFGALTGVGRAWALADMGRPAEAEKELARAAEVVDTYQFEVFRASLALVAGKAAEAGGDLTAAAAHYRECLERAVQVDPIFLVHLARALRQQGDFKGARKILDDALELHPAHPAALLELALVEFELGHADRSREHLAAARAAWTEADPGYPPARAAAELAAQLERVP